MDKQYIDLKEFIKEIENKAGFLEHQKGFRGIQNEADPLTKIINAKIHSYKLAIYCATRISKRGTFKEKKD